MTYFKLITWDEKNFIIKISPDLTAAEYAHVHSLMLGFPQRHYSRQLEGWEIPQTEANISYLQSHFKAEEYEVDEDASIVLEYTEKTRLVLQKKLSARWQYKFNNVVPHLDYEAKTKPYKHQIVATDSFHRVEFFGLLMEMGTGKTKIIIDEICWSEIPRTLIVCPKTVIGTWVRELKKHATKPYVLTRLRSHWWGAQDLINGLQANQKIKIWITNYDRLRNNLDALAKMKFDLCVLDESTYVKNPQSKRTKAALELAESCKRRAILTGTPAGNTLLDLWSQFEFLQPGVLGYSNFYQFKGYYGRFLHLKCGFDKLIGYKNIDILKTRMATCSFVVTKKECLDLPPKIYETRYVEMGETQSALYEQMLQICLADLEGNLSPNSTVQATVVIVQLLRLAQICCGYLKTISLDVKPIPKGDVKIQAVKDILESLNPDDKVVIWARFRYDIEQLKKLFGKMNVKWVALTGAESESQREHSITSFASEHGARVLIGEPGSGGMGVTLIGSEKRPCTTVIYYSNDFSNLKRVQSEDRSHRIGVKMPVTYIDIVCEGTIEERICKVLQAKKQLNEQIKDFSSIKQFLLGENGSGKLRVFQENKREIPETIYREVEKLLSARSE